MSDMIQLEMTLDEARETDRLIKRHINTTRYLLLDMRDRKGWKALGYESFKEYGEKSLGYEKAYLTRLADAGEISLQLGYDPELPIGNPPPESQLRPLKSVPEDERKAIWEEATRKAEEEHAKLTAKRIEQEVAEWKRRNQEWADQSNVQRKKIRELEQQVDLLNTEKPEPEIIEKIIENPVVPPEFASLEGALAAKRTELENLSRNTQEAIQKNRQVFESRERLKKEVEDLTALLSKHKASEREQVEHKRLTDSIMQSTALFLSEIQALEHAPSAEQRRRWDKAIQQLMDSASAARSIIDSLNSMPLEGILIEQAA